MATFRRNHQGSNNRNSSIIRMLLIMMVLAAILFVAFLSGGTGLFSGPESSRNRDYSGPDQWYFPSLLNGTFVGHRYFSLSYDETREQAEWVAYILEAGQLEGERVERTDWFSEDPAVPEGSATYYDYRGSGYDRGHLVPAADRAFSPEAMEETFLMSNISPQVHSFNAGIWRELEELTRDWAGRDGRLYIVCGPLFGPDPVTIGKNEVAVPELFYKVLLDLAEPEMKGIGFIIPNQMSDITLHEYAVSIDEVEARSGIDLFPELMTEELEQQLESEFDPKLWPLNPAKFKRRIEVWNKDRN